LISSVYVCTCADADELEWYIPAGIGLPDLRRALAVIEQFEKAPLDLGGKRAAQLLRKKRRSRRRQRQRPRHTSADSDSDGANNSGSEDDEENESKGKKARAREREAYKSAQFIEDSDDEYGRDIDAFFAKEAELRERTALAAVDSALGTGTMRASGTKKRRRPRGRPVAATAADVEGADADGDADADADADDGATAARQLKRRAVSQRDSSQSESEESGPESQVPKPTPRDRRPPKARPRYRGSATAAKTIGEPPEEQRDPVEPEGMTVPGFLAPDDADVSSHDIVGDQDRNASDAGGDESANHRVSMSEGGGAVPNGSASRKGRVIISDEEE
jgi:replication fork protection complex subunit Tof1/Swi1